MSQLPGMSTALAERKEHQWWGRKGGQEKDREESIWGWKCRNCNGDAGFEENDTVWETLLEEVLLLYVIE